MSTGIRRTGWGLALAVLCIGSLARAQFPPAGPPEPVTKMPAAAPSVTTSVPVPTSPVSIFAPPAPAQAPHAPESHGEAKHEEHHDAHHEEHHGEEEEHDAFYFDAEYLLVRPYRHGQDFAIVGNNPNAGPIGVIHSVEGDYTSSLRFGARYRPCGSEWDLGVVYTYIHNEQKSGAGAQDGQVVFPTLTFPGPVTAVAVAGANVSVNVNVYDFEFGRTWHPSECLGLRFFVGPRFAGIDDKFFANYTGGQVNLDAVRRQITFAGGGARIGGEATWSFWENFGFYTRGSLSLLTGWFHSELSEQANGVTVVNVSEKFHKMAPVAELGLGISYKVNWLRVSAGYEFIDWFGLDEGIDFADDVSPGKYNRRTSDLGFNGIVFRAELLF
jgi:hypothetical protein